MSLLLDASKRGGPHLEWRVRLFAAGAVLGVAGMWLEERWLLWAGIGVLAAGALLRLVPGGEGDGGRAGGSEGEGPAPRDGDGDGTRP